MSKTAHDDEIQLNFNVGIKDVDQNHIVRYSKCIFGDKIIKVKVSAESHVCFSTILVHSLNLLMCSLTTCIQVIG